MNQDELLRDLARLAREDASARDADAERRWERLARGELSETELAAIRKEAETDPEVAAMLEAFRPLDDSLKAKIAERAVAELAASASRANVVPLRASPSRTSRRIATFAVPLAAAAALTLWLTRPAVDAGGVASLDSIPRYTLAVHGGERTTRGNNAPASGTLELHGDSGLELVLRPDRTAPGDLGVRAFLAQGGEVRAWAPPIERSADGSVRIAGTAGAVLGVPAGTWDAVVVIGNGASLPDAPAIASALKDRSAPHAWQLFVTRVHLVDAPAP